MIDLLLDGPSGQQPVDGHLLVLTDPPWPLPGLSVGAGVPVWVVDDDPVGTGQVHSQTPHTCGQQKEKDAGILSEREYKHIWMIQNRLVYHGSG